MITFWPSRNSQIHNENERIQPVAIMLGMGSIVFVAAFINYFPHKIGIVISALDPSTFVPLLSPGLYDYLPWLNLYWAFTFILGAFLLISGRWHPYAQWADLALTFFASWILFQMIFGASIFGLNPQWLAGQELSAQTLATLQSTIIPMTSMLFRFVLGIAFLILAWMMIRKLRQLLPTEAADGNTYSA